MSKRIFAAMLFFAGLAACGGDVIDQVYPAGKGDNETNGEASNSNGQETGSAAGGSGKEAGEKLCWDAPTTNDDGTALIDLAGYKVYYGTMPGYFPSSIDVGNETCWTISEANRSARFFYVVKAYSLSGTESGPSNEVSY